MYNIKNSKGFGTIMAIIIGLIVVGAGIFTIETIRKGDDRKDVVSEEENFNNKSNSSLEEDNVDNEELAHSYPEDEAVSEVDHSSESVVNDSKTGKDYFLDYCREDLKVEGACECIAFKLINSYGVDGLETVMEKIKIEEDNDLEPGSSSQETRDTLKYVEECFPLTDPDLVKDNWISGCKESLTEKGVSTDEMSEICTCGYDSLVDKYGTVGFMELVLETELEMQTGKKSEKLEQSLSDLNKCYSEVYYR